MNDDELTESERAVLGAWTPLAPPRDFADRVLAARARPAPRRRWPIVAGIVAVVAAAATIAVVTRTPDRSARGELVAATVRTTRTLGDRAVAVAEPTATLAWHIDDDGDAVIEQRAGDVFYRVDPGGSFVVHTPAGDVRVTGTCFRIEVTPMNRTKQLVLSGAVGAAVATGIVVTVYEGHVIADSKTGHRAELVAGQRATINPDGRTTITPDRTAALDDATATREQLAARTQMQQTEIARLRARVVELERGTRGRGHGSHHDTSAEDGRPWYDPSPERLAAWVAECHVRADEPNLDAWQPQTELGTNTRGLEPDELPHVNAALTEVQQQWKALVRSLYIEATGDVQGADTLSIDAMRGEIEDKSVPGESSLVLRKIAQERAGHLQPPTDLSKASPFERMFRAYIALGDQSEQAIAKRLGPARAKEIRGDGWGSRSDWSGCPKN